MGESFESQGSASLDLQSSLFNRQAEEAVLGAVLLTPETYLDVSHFLSADDFYIVRHQWIWEAFAALQERRQPIDLVTVPHYLEERGLLEEAGGMAYLLSLINQTPSALHAEAYAHIVEQMAVRRRVLGVANGLAQLAYDQGQSVENLLDKAEQSIFGVSERRIQHDLQPIDQVLSGIYDRVDEASQRDEELFGVPTGLIDLDRLLGGMQKSDFLIVAGRPGSGKTGFLLSVAKNAAQIHKKHVAIFSLEMSNEQLVQRLLAQETRIDSQKLRNGKLDPDEWSLFTHAVEVLSAVPIWLDDTPGITPLQMRTKARRLHLEHRLDLIIVDYIQLMASDMRTENRVQEVSYISRSLKNLARELNVPVLAAAQLSRSVEQRAGKRPQLSDLRESGSLEQDTDVVMFINRPDYLEKDNPRQNVAELIVAKHRNGPTHPGIELVFLSKLARFENAASLPGDGRGR